MNKKRNPQKALAVLLSLTLVLTLFVSIGITSVSFAATVPTYDVSEATLAFDCFNNKFYTVTNGNGYYKQDTNGGQTGFWTEAEMIEMVIDTYNRTGNSVHKNMITELYNGFINKWGSDWQNNIYNDDIMWMCIACLRGYQATGNIAMRDKAKDQFDKTYARAWSTDLGGGLWWTTAKNEKNSCVNGPGAIAAYLLYSTLGDSNYLTKATNIYNWQKSKLFNATTGAVYDNIKKDGTVNGGSTTYNQGTFIGIANYLYKQTGNTTYLSDAQKTADFTKNNMSNATTGILPDEYGTGDCPGFKGIFARWMCKFIKDSGQFQYLAWMQTNANAAWTYRNSSGLMWAKWWTRTSDTSVLTSWECSSGVVIMQVCPGATFYQDADYAGKVVSLCKGNYTLAQLQAAGIPDNWVSSLRVPSGMTVEIYQNDNYTGTMWKFTADTNYVGAACNDQMTSVKIY